jgi:glycosyltransferase involved in cell wall biosynthesis
LPYKGIDTLLEAVAILRYSYPGVRLTVNGNIPLQGYGGFLRRKVRASGIEENVSFSGWRPAEKIAEELAHAHVYVIPSFIENSPNSLAEAQLVGTPVVASYTGGIPSMVSDKGTGLLFPPGDAEFCATQIKRMFEDNELALQCSEKGRQVAFARHNSKNVAVTLVDLYKEIIG